MTGDRARHPGADRARRPRANRAQRRGADRAQRRFGIRTAVAFGCALVFAVLAALVRSAAGPVLRVDRRTDESLHGFALRHSGFTSLMRLVSDTGSTPAWLIILTPVVIWLLYRRLLKLAAFVAVTAIGSSLLNNLVKLLVGRARPHLTDPVAVAAGKSFPSGHGQAAMVGYAILVAVFLPAVPRGRRPWLVVPAAAMVLLIGFSRIALGVHYLSDVIGAYLIGMVWFLGMAGAFGAWRREEGRPSPDVAEGLEPEQGDRLAP